MNLREVLHWLIGIVEGTDPQPYLRAPEVHAAVDAHFDAADAEAADAEAPAAAEAEQTGE